jgi:selenocysteine lyase/cysteine desulfurase
MPEGFEAGTHNLSGIAGLKAGVEFVLEKKVNTIGKHEQELTNLAAEKLGDLTGIKIYGPVDPEARAGLLSFNIAGIDPTTISFMLDHQFDIAVRSGLHCAPQAHRSLGSFPEGSIRISPGWFNTSEEIDLFCDAVAQCIVPASS